MNNKRSKQTHTCENERHPGAGVAMRPYCHGNGQPKTCQYKLGTRRGRRHDGALGARRNTLYINLAHLGLTISANSSHYLSPVSAPLLVSCLEKAG